MDPFNWTCPYCGHAQSVIGNKYQRDIAYLDEDRNTEFGMMMLWAKATICSNNDCRRVTLTAELSRVRKGAATGDHGNKEFGQSIKQWNLLPESLAKPQPDCVPKVLQEDYYEACSIQRLSPKASATLLRRCLQGMIRDFCGISKNRLIDEIRELRRQIDAHEADRNIAPDTVDTIDAVREIGNIGAHMERNIDEIIEVDENEVEVLINLIEMLFKEWYVARETRQKRIAQVTAIAEDKAGQKNKNKDGEAKENPEAAKPAQSGN